MHVFFWLFFSCNTTKMLDKQVAPNKKKTPATELQKSERVLLCTQKNYHVLPNGGRSLIPRCDAVSPDPSTSVSDFSPKRAAVRQTHAQDKQKPTQLRVRNFFFLSDSDPLGSPHQRGGCCFTILVLWLIFLRPVIIKKIVNPMISSSKQTNKTNNKMTQNFFFEVSGFEKSMNPVSVCAETMTTVAIVFVEIRRCSLRFFSVACLAHEGHVVVTSDVGTTAQNEVEVQERP